MKKVAEVLFDSDTKFKINIPTLLMVISSTVVVVSSVFAMKTNIELSINSIEENQIRIEDKFDDAIYDLEESDEKQNTRITEYEAVQSDIKASLVRLETHTIWIIDDLKKDK